MSGADTSDPQFWAQLLQTLALLAAFAVAWLLTILSGRVLRRLGPEKGALIPQHGLPLRSVAPDAEMTDLRTGATLRMPDLRGRRVMLAFLSGHCRPCVELVPHLNWLAAKNCDTRFIVVVNAGAGERHLVELDAGIAVVEDTREHRIGTAFEVRLAPLVYVIDAGGRVVIRAVPNTRLQLEDTLDGAGSLQQTAWVPVEGG